MKKNKNCYDCAYRGEVPGSVHTQCMYDWSKSKLNPPSWWIFPVNFDPVWMVGECPAFSKEKNKDMVRKQSPFDVLGTILGERL